MSGWVVETMETRTTPPTRRTGPGRRTSNKAHQSELQKSLITKLSDATEPETSQKNADKHDFDDELSKNLNAKVHKSGQKVIVEFPETSFFKLGETQLSTEGKSELGRFLKIYQPFAGSYYLNILAYTDNKKVIPYPGRKFSDNLELSALRSVSAMRALQTMGIPLNRMKLGGYGEMKMTVDELNRKIASTPDYKTNGLKLARKIVLIIEPELRENL